MLTILFFILQWVAILVLFVVLILLFIWMISGIRAKVPFIPVPNSILPDIYKTLAIAEGSVVYDLGCGDGRVLFYLSKFVSSAKYIGIENSLFPSMLAQARSWWHKRQTGIQIAILHEDFFKRDLSDATHVFTYLYPNIMDELLPKFDRELAPGTRLVSITFKFTQKQPTAEFDLGRSKYKLARKMYVYEF